MLSLNAHPTDFCSRRPGTWRGAGEEAAVRCCPPPFSAPWRAETNWTFD